MRVEAAVVLLVVLLPFLWLLLSPATASPRLPAAAAPRRTADDMEDEMPDVPPLPAGRMRAAEAPAPEAVARPERLAPAPEALDGHAVVSMEPLAARPAPRRTAQDAEPNRVEEHARFRRRVAAPSQADPAAEAAPFLDARELRRTLVMAEVLGPPRSLRPLGEDR